MDLAANDSKHIDLNLTVFGMDIGYLTRLIREMMAEIMDYSRSHVITKIGCVS